MCCLFVQLCGSSCQTQVFNKKAMPGIIDLSGVDKEVNKNGVTNDLIQHLVHPIKTFVRAYCELGS